MGKVYALLVGIDGYGDTSGLRPLKGCVNDVEAAGRWLADRCGERLSAVFLRDAEATLAAVTGALRAQLGRAGPRDTALLWFSGHGRELTATTDEERRIEPTGKCQALVCADGVLPDKRLGAELDAVAARGAHVTVVLDCCYSGGATRERPDGPAVRGLPPLPAPPGLFASRDASAPRPAARHVLLAAGRLNEPVYETETGGTVHGVFSRALLDVLAGTDGGTGDGATCREILSAAHARVARSTGFPQHPVLHPSDDPGGIADRPFLGGAAPRTPSPHLLRFGAEGWEVDCGEAHGLRAGGAGEGADGTRFVLTGPARRPPVGIRAREVRADRTLVDVDGPAPPDPALPHPVALSALALPPADVVLDIRGASRAARLLERALATAGPGGGPSALLRPVADGGPRRARTVLRVEVRGTLARVLPPGGPSAPPAPDPLPLTGAEDARRTVDCLNHLARWYQLHRLAAPRWPTAAHLRVEITPWDGTRPVLPDGNGELLFAYGRGPDGAWREPGVSVRVHNRSRRTLWCALLNLTDSYEAHVRLFPGDFIGPEGTGHALDGARVRLSLPPGRPVRPGAQVRDWLYLVVAEGELNTLPFRLPRWDPGAPLPGSRAGGRPGEDGILRLSAPFGDRDMGGDGGDAFAGQWGVTGVPLRTVVP